MADEHAWFYEVCSSLREKAVDESVISALTAHGFTNYDTLSELLKMSVAERASILGITHTSNVTNAKFADALKECIFEGVKLGGKSYIDIIIYNLSLEGRIDETPQMLMDNYTSILSFATFLAGFEFVAVSFGGSDNSRAAEVAALMLYMGFYLASFAAVGCVLIIEFLRFSVDETTKFKLACITKYRALLEAVPIASFLSVILMYLSLNINAHVVFSLPSALISNFVSILTAAGLFHLFYSMVMRRQIYSSTGRRMYLASDKPPSTNKNLDIL